MLKEPFAGLPGSSSTEVMPDFAAALANVRSPHARPPRRCAPELRASIGRAYRLRAVREQLRREVDPDRRVRLRAEERRLHRKEQRFLTLGSAPMKGGVAAIAYRYRLRVSDPGSQPSQIRTAPMRRVVSALRAEKRLVPNAPHRVAAPRRERAREHVAPPSAAGSRGSADRPRRAADWPRDDDDDEHHDDRRHHDLVAASSAALRGERV
jgi:hypothetical protein